jgi:hypothetical protein
MSRKLIIASMVFGIISLTSCQKDEFQEMYIESAPNAELSITDDSLDDSNSISNGALDGTELSTTTSDEHIGESEEIIIISIKEVSDGDDEADSGDDSKSE